MPPPPPQYSSPMTAFSPYPANAGSGDATKPPYVGPMVVEYEVKNATVEQYDNAGDGSQNNKESPMIHGLPNINKPNE